MLLACMCNQPERLEQALAPLPLVIPPPVGRWSVASVVGGEILLARTPATSDRPLDLRSVIAQQRSDCVVVAGGRTDDGGPDDLSPFRFRRWMLAEDPTHAISPATWTELITQLPEFLRRNLRGRSSAELTLHALVALIHDQGRVDDPSLREAALAQVLIEARGLIGAGLLRSGASVARGNVCVSNSRALAITATSAPLAIYALRITNERGHRDESFRGVMITSGIEAAPAGDDTVPELVPIGSLVTVSRDLRVTIAPLA